MIKPAPYKILDPIPLNLALCTVLLWLRPVPRTLDLILVFEGWFDNFLRGKSSSLSPATAPGAVCKGS